MVTRVRSAVRLALALALSVLVTQATVMPDGVALAQPPPGGGGGPGRPPPGGGRPPPGGGSFGSRVLDGLRDAGTGLATDLVGNLVGGGGPGGQGLWQGGEDERDNANPLQVIPGAPPEIQGAADLLLGSRDNVDVEKITADRPAYLLPKDERVSKAIGLNGLHAGPSAFTPEMAGMVCDSDGVSIKLDASDPEGKIWYSSDVRKNGVGGATTEVTCLWIVDFPPNIPDGTLIAVNTDSFKSETPAKLRVFSGMQTCVEDDSLYTRLQIGNERGFSRVDAVQRMISFVPTRDNSIAIQLDITQAPGDSSTEFSFELELRYGPLYKRYPPGPNTPRQPDPPPGMAVLLPPAYDEIELREDGILPGYLSLYNSNGTRTFEQMAAGNPLLEDMTGTEKGVFIINNQDFESLDGIERIKTIEKGPIVISNNPRLHMPINEVIDWLNGVDGDIYSIDLSFNDLYGQIPESYCDLLEKVPKIDLSQNINLCGELPSCMKPLKDAAKDVYLEDDDYEDDSDGDEDDEEELNEETQLHSLMGLWAGNNVGESCDLLNLTSGFSDDTIGCSPLGYRADLKNQGAIEFSSLYIETQEFKDSSCVWSLDRMDKMQRARLGDRSILILHFDALYTSINGGQALCNDLSSGHNFDSALINGPLIDMFAVTAYNETYKRGNDIYTASGSELPAPMAIYVNPSFDRLRLQLIQKSTSPLELDLYEPSNRAIQQCGGTSLKYAFVEPISTLEDLTSFVTKYRNTVTGEVDRSIVVASCNATGNGTKIEDLSALESVTKIKGDLIVMNCPTLRSFAGAEKLLNVTDSVMVQMNGELKDVSGLSSLRAVGGSLVLIGNNKLRKLSGLENLRSIAGSLKIETMGQLVSLRGLAGLESVGNNVIIKSNPLLIEVGMVSLHHIGTSLVIRYNKVLGSFSGLEMLMQIGGSLDVQVNEKLSNFTGLENLLRVNGSFGVFTNKGLEKITQLQKLEHVAGSFLIASNPVLETVELPAIKSIGSPPPSSAPNRRKLLLKDDDDTKYPEDDVGDESSNHLFAIEFNENLRSLAIPESIERLPWNVLITRNPALSGFVPWDLLSKKNVVSAILTGNNYTGPIPTQDPDLCGSSTTIRYIDVSGNQGICGFVSEDCEYLNIEGEDTSFGEPCDGIEPPMCFKKELNSEETCTVLARKFDSKPTKLEFMFPTYRLQDEMPKNLNASIRYRFSVGTKQGEDNVQPMTEMKDYEFVDENKTSIRYTWDITDRHMSLMNGQTYFVTVNAFDITGVSVPNITSNGTTIDSSAPKVTNAKVVLEARENGDYSVKWGGFESLSGIRRYRMTLREGKNAIDEITVPGDKTSLDGVIEASKLKNGTMFTAEVIGVSKANLTSPKVLSLAVIPIPNGKKTSSSTIAGVVVGVLIACALIGGVCAYFVLRHLRRQREKAKEEDWLRRLNSSVYTFLQGTGTQAGKLSYDEASVCLTNDDSKDSDNSKDCVFIFTDIQSSTELCEQDADAYLLLQEAHDEIMRNALAEIGGHEVDTEGDAFQCMFPNVVISLLFCFKVQEDLAGYDWPESVLSLYGCARVKSKLYRNKYVWAGPRVRMAVHFAKGGTYLAKSHPTTRRVAYGGKAWDTTSTLSDVGHGGQIIVSESAWRQLTANGDEGAAGYPIFEDLGRYQIGDQGLPMRLLQVTPARSALSEREFPALRDVDMLDRGQGMNIVPSMDGKVAVVCAIIEPSRFIGVAERFITLIAKREQASKDFSMDENKMDSVASPLATSPVFVPEYSNEIDLMSLNNTVRRSTSLRGDERSLGELLNPQNNVLKEENTTLYFTDEHQQAVDVVVSTLQSLVSQFGGYVIRTVEEVDTPKQMMVIAFKSSSSAVRFALAAQTTLMEYPWPKEVNEAFGYYAKACLSRNGTPLFNGPCVAMSAHVTKIEKFSMFERDDGSFRTNHMNVGHMVCYKYNGILQALELAFIANGGQTVLSSSFFDSKWQRGLSLSQTQVTDLGAHGVRYFSHPVKLIEILPKILQERTDFFSPLASQRILSVGAPNAPGAHGEPVALVFTYPRVADEFQNSEHASQAVDNFSETVRILLPRYNGYESQEVGTGCFFLSFPSVDDAVAWSIHLQLILRRSDWNSSKSLTGLAMDDAQKLSMEDARTSATIESGGAPSVTQKNFFPASSMEVIQEKMSSGELEDVDDQGEDSLFSFFSTHNAFHAVSLQMRHLVLVQIGISYGMPTKVTPHVQTGRADYFGPMVNLSARVAKGTKPGDVHLSSYEDLSETLRFGDDPDQQSCYLKGMEFANEGKWVDVDLSDEGMRSFKGVKDERRLYSVKVSSDPYSLRATPTSSL